MKLDSKPIIAHFSIEIRLNEDTSWRYSAPVVEKNLDISVPVELFDESRFSIMMKKIIKEMENAFPKVKLEHERELAEKEAAKLAEESVEEPH